MKRIFLLFTMISLLIGCSSAYNENITEAETALESGDFEKALEFYNLALEEKKDSTEVKDIIALLNDYETLQGKIENDEWTEALDLANNMLKNDDIVPSLQKEVKELLTTIEAEKEKEEQIASELKKVEKLIKDEDVEKASSKLNELENEIRSNALKSEIEDLHNKLKVAEKRVAEKERKAKEKEAEKKRLEEEAKQKAAKASNLKEKYLQRANELDYAIAKQASELYGNNPPSGFYGQYNEDWDGLLNEVWGVLKDTLPADEFEALKAEQNQWINKKDQRFSELPEDTAVDRAAGVDFLTNLTEERTFYLIANYMN